MAQSKQSLIVDLHAHILPLLDLCRYAAMASTAIEGLQNVAAVVPDFKRHLEGAAPDISELADYGGGAMVAGGLWVAMELLHHYADTPNVPPRDISATGARAEK